MPPEYGNVLEVSYQLPGHLATGVSGEVTLTFTPKVRLACSLAQWHSRPAAAARLPRTPGAPGLTTCALRASGRQSNEDIETSVAMLAETGPFEIPVR